MLDQLARDLKHAARALWRDRSFTATTVATLALCLAANAAIFAVVQAVLLAPLPFPEPDRLVKMYNAYPGAGALRGDNGVPDYDDRVRETTAFEAIALYRTQGATLGGDGGAEAERVTSMPVTPSFFRILRTAPFRGRLFADADGEHGQHEKVVLSYGLWQRLFAGQDSAIGQSVRVNGVPFTVVGVLPAEFPLRDATRCRCGRPRPSPQRSGPTIGATATAGRCSRVWPRAPPCKRRSAKSMRSTRATSTASRRSSPCSSTPVSTPCCSASTTTWWPNPARPCACSGALPPSCCSSARSTSPTSCRCEPRRRCARWSRAWHSAPRSGRSRARFSPRRSCSRPWAAPWDCCWAGGRCAPRRWLGLDALPRGGEIGLDGAVAAYTLGLVALVGVLVTVLPVLRLRHLDVAGAIREEGRSGTASRRMLAMRRVLVTGQVAFALVLLVGAGMLLASFSRVLAIDPGFRAEGVFTGRIALPAARYADDAALRSAYDRLLLALRAIPGASAAGLTDSLPFSGDYSDSVILAEGYQMAPGESVISPSQIRVSEGLTEALGMSFVRGRAFDARDGAGAPRVVIVDERLAQRFWKDQDAIGRRLYFPSDPSDMLKPPADDQWLTVVGVVRNVRLRALAAPAGSGLFGAYYFPLAQSTDRSVSIVIRTTQPPELLTSAVRAAVRGVDAAVPVYDVSSMRARLDGAMTDRRTPMILAVTFAAVALLLCAVGLYGVLAYQVAQRSREIGIRMALGASAPGIFQMVLREGALVIGVGVAAGLAGAWALRTVLQAQLYEVDAMEPAVLVAVVTVLTVTALVACTVPARRAAATDPAQALADR